MRTLIRTATADDAPALCEVVHRSITECCEADHHGDAATIARWLANKTVVNMAAWMGGKDAIGLVATRAGGAVGCALVTGNVLALCYVTPETIHQGVGTALLQEAMSRALAQRVTELRLDSTRTALPFYLRHGFALTGPPERWAGLEAQPMRIKLAPPPATGASHATSRAV